MDETGRANYHFKGQNQKIVANRFLGRIMGPDVGGWVFWVILGDFDFDISYHGIRMVITRGSRFTLKIPLYSIFDISNQ